MDKAIYTMMMNITYHRLANLALDKCAALLHMLWQVFPSHWQSTLLARLWVVLTLSLIVCLYEEQKW